ncbi:class I SAM-dependent methyltransferase [Halosegnis sp.]|uniref:class I SAM-dependent methyltransferase n=1 Tax=Halosegnis sp. TaxID=2864959 RepID=UPI0035D4CE6D
MVEEGNRRGVQATYDRIASHFAETRSHPWPQITEFLTDKCGDIGLDLGCANGRHIAPLAERCNRVLGVDLSRALLSMAADRGGADLLQADAARLPVRTGAVDVAVYIATLHHLPNREMRRRSLDELARVLGPDGQALVSVWSVTHSKFNAETGFDTTVDWTLPDGETVGRFYHIYDPEEFAADLTASRLVTERTFTEAGNCFGVVGSEGKRTYDAAG